MRMSMGCAAFAWAGAASIAGAQIEILHRTAETPTEQWAITAANGTDYATVGSTVAAGRRVIVFTRHGPGGVVMFQRLLVSGGNEIPFCVQQTRDGGYIIAGETDQPGGNTGFVTLIKLDAAGTLLWARMMPGSLFNDRPIGVGLRELSNGNYAIVARTRVAGLVGQFGTAAVFTPAGAPVWSSVYRDPRYQTPFMSFADLREVRDAAGAFRLVVVGFSARDNAAPREAIAVLLDAANGANPIARSYDFFNALEDTHANGIVDTTPRSFRVTGRITDPSNAAIVDDSFVLDIDDALNPIGASAVYDNFKVAHAAIEPSFTAVGVTTLAGNYLDPSPNATPDGMLMTISAAPPLLVWSHRYGRTRTDQFRGLITSPAGIVAAGVTDANGDWQYEVITDPAGRDGCERPWPLERLTTLTRNSPFEMPRIEWTVREHRLDQPRARWTDRVVCKQCPTDFNNDGFVDFFDYDDYVTCFETLRCPPGKDADFNGDGFVDFFDYDDFVTAFERGC